MTTVEGAPGWIGESSLFPTISQKEGAVSIAEALRIAETVKGKSFNTVIRQKLAMETQRQNINALNARRAFL
jgi:hypothetical protein